jgi:hypothetical protein
MAYKLIEAMTVHAVGLCVGLAATLTIAQVPAGIKVPRPVTGQMGDDAYAFDCHFGDGGAALWLVACAAIVVSCAPPVSLTSQ